MGKIQIKQNVIKNKTINNKFKLALIITVDLLKISSTR